MGCNVLNTMVKRMCGEAGVEGNKTNHSLRATGATTLFRASVPEKLIQQRTGHRSVEALRQYEHTTTSQHEKVSKVLASVNVNAGTLPSLSKPVQQPSAPLAPYQLSRMHSQHYPGTTILFCYIYAFCIATNATQHTRV